MNHDPSNPSSQGSILDIGKFRNATGSGWFWPLVALILAAAFLLTTVRVGKVSGEQVGILLNKITGKITVINQPGTKIYNGFTNDFFVLDRTLQVLNMVAEDRTNKSQDKNLKIKTIDGSDVYVDLIVQYRIIPEMADLVVLTSGPAGAYKEKWAKDYMRSLCRNYLGELTTEQFYDSSLRDVKTVKAREEANQRLNPYGIMIDSIVIPRKPHFYQEYEEMIKQKKLADQEVLEEQSKAQAAKQRQQTRIVEETNKKNVAVEQYQGQMAELIIAAEAEGERARQQAKAYYDKVTIGAEAGFYERQKTAGGLLARKKAEAEGIRELAEALSGPGGRNLVKMEYARKLKDIIITGKPYSISSDVERFEHLRGPAASWEQGKQTGAQTPPAQKKK
jgi:regulator of protease activity HflC (stomatin/prohibitin superfamily)